jgi:hypothetical protein
MIMIGMFPVSIETIGIDMVAMETTGMDPVSLEETGTAMVLSETDFMETNIIEAACLEIDYIRSTSE